LNLKATMLLNPITLAQMNLQMHPFHTHKKTFFLTHPKPKYMGNALEIAQVLKLNKKATYKLLLFTNSSKEVASRQSNQYMSFSFS
jgi:hypothetical protein